MTSHEGPEEGEQRGGNTVTAAGKPYTRDVHHDTEPAPPRASGYFAGHTQALTRTETNNFLILLPDHLIAIEVNEGVAWFDPDYWSLEDFLDTSFLA